MIATRIPSILPPLTLREAIETTKVHSVCGLLNGQHRFVTTRPFRNPHHTISDAGLLGGTGQPTPGEVSLAHNGVLFLDELPEFHRSTLEVMRQPFEDGKVTISRAAGSLTFPAEFMLVAAMNPCPCGHYGDLRRECRCRFKNTGTGRQGRCWIGSIFMSKYRQWSSKIWRAPRVEESSASIRERVTQARFVQLQRFSDQSKVTCNARMTPRLLRKYCPLDSESMELLREAVANLSLSARAYDRILKVARTIADLAGMLRTQAGHLAEAIAALALSTAFRFSG
jgi:magnesium chelatase family protein